MMNIINAFEEIKQGRIVEDIETTDRFKYITDEQNGDLMIYHYNKHYGYILNNEEFNLDFIKSKFKIVDDEIEKNWN